MPVAVTYMFFSLGSLFSSNIFVGILFWGCTTQHVELPCPGVEPMSPVLEAQSLNHWTTREALVSILEST